MDDGEEVRQRAAQLPDTYCISAHSGEGIAALLAAIGAKLEASMVELTALLPYSAGDLLDGCHKMGSVKSSEFTEQGVKVVVVVPPALAGRLKPYISGAAGLARSTSASSAVAGGAA